MYVPNLATFCAQLLLQLVDSVFDDSSMLERQSLVQDVCRYLQVSEPARRPSMTAMVAPPGGGKSSALMFLAQPGRLLKTAEDLGKSGARLVDSLRGKHVVAVTTTFNNPMTTPTTLPLLSLVQEASIRLLYRFACSRLMHFLSHSTFQLLLREQHTSHFCIVSMLLQN